MKSLHPNFQLSKRMGGFFTVVAGAILFTVTPAIHAGEVSSPPKWIPFEKMAINLYQTGINQEGANPSGAVKTLQQARQDSSDAINNGGGSNPAVLHNDHLIGQALQLAQADASRTSDNKEDTVKPNSNGNNPVTKPGNFQVHATGLHSTPQHPLNIKGS